MAIVYLILLLASAIVLLLASLPSPPPTKINLLAAGVFLFVVVFTIKAALHFSGG